MYKRKEETSMKIHESAENYLENKRKRDESTAYHPICRVFFVLFAKIPPQAKTACGGA